MANVKTITATTTESAVEFNATYQFMWFRNFGENDCYICAHSGIVANADDVTLLKAGEVARLTLPQPPAQRTAYIKAADGSNTVEVHAQNYSDCPFKMIGKGGGQSITVEPLTVTDNGVYTAPTGKAYSPVTVDVVEQPWQPLQDGYSNFWFELTNDTLSPWLNFSAKNANAVIDWGDGSGEVALDTLTPTHTYSKAGKYVVKVKGVTGIDRQHTDPFTDYISVLKYVELNNEITTLSNYALAQCGNLIRLTASDNLATIGEYAFQYCGNLTDCDFCESVTSLGANVFQHDMSVTKGKINVSTLPAFTFHYNTMLADIDLSDFTSIGNYAVAYCRLLKEVTLSENITSIGSSAFIYCASLTEIHCQATIPPTLGTATFNNLPSNWICYVPVGYGDTYKAASGWSTYADHILEEGETPTRAMVAKFNAMKTDEPQDDMR